MTAPTAVLQSGPWNTAAILGPALPVPATATVHGPLGHIPGMVWVPPGPCTIGTKAWTDAQPIQHPHIDGFYVAQTMGTNGVFDQFVAAQPATSFVVIGKSADQSTMSLGEAADVAQAKALFAAHVERLGTGAFVGLELVRRVAITRPDWTAKPPHIGARKPAFGMNQFEAGACATWIGAQLQLPAGWICRLATEFEAEKGGRGPQGCDYGTDDGTRDPSKGCYSVRGPVNVAQYPPNGYGLYDAMGLGWEWTETKYDPKYYGHMPIRNPRGPETGESIVLRGGGSWADVDAEGSLAASRCSGDPAVRYVFVGFRVVVAPQDSFT